MEKEYVWVVVSNNPDEVVGEVEGVFRNQKDAKKCFNEIKKNWKKYAGKDIQEETDTSDYYQLTTSDETMEVKIDYVLIK